jgi:hypothetical protein
VPELSGRQLFDEWRKLMDSVRSTAASAAARSEVPSQLMEPMQRQLELVGELIEREQRLQKEVASRVMAPSDAVFDLLEESGETLRLQAEALEAAGAALRETAALMKRQAVLFERTVSTIRKPTDLARSAAGLERRSPGGRAGDASG